MTEKLLPCPFCKKQPGEKVGPPALVRCVTEGCEGKAHGAETPTEWNTRVGAAPEAGEPGALEYERNLFSLAEQAYFKAGETSSPDDWLQACLLAQQHRNALKRIHPSRFAASSVEPVALSQDDLRFLKRCFNEKSDSTKETHSRINRWLDSAIAAPTSSPDPATCKDSLQVQSSPEPDAVREWDNAAFQNTDDAPALKVLAAVRHCAASWDKTARLLGNVRAYDIFRACNEAIAALSAPAAGAWQDISTAPKDREILAVRIEWWEPENGNHRWIHGNIRQTKWAAERQRFGFNHERQPTHWTEVPAIPALPIPRKERVPPQPITDAVTIVAPPIPPLLQREWMAQALFEVDAPDHLEWDDAGIDKRERYLALADTAIAKAAVLTGSPRNEREGGAT